MKAYVINLEKDTDRLRFMTDRLNELGIEFERIPAIAADEMAPDMMEYLRAPRADGFTVRWKQSEAACFFSHGKVWEKISHDTDPYGLVFEDDVHLSGDLRAFTDSDDWIPADAQIIRIETSTNRLLLDRGLQANGRAVARVLSTAWCAGAYILSRETAQYLVSLEQPLYDHTDAYLFSHERSALARTLKTYQVYPALAVQDKFHTGTPQFQSNIEVAQDQAAKNTRSMVSALLKTLRGYRRISFKD